MKIVIMMRVITDHHENPDHDAGDHDDRYHDAGDNDDRNHDVSQRCKHALMVAAQPSQVYFPLSRVPLDLGPTHLDISVPKSIRACLSKYELIAKEIAHTAECYPMQTHKVGKQDACAVC